MSSLPVRAYTNSFSYERGEAVRVHVDAVDAVDISLIRMRSSSSSDTGLDTPVDWSHAGTYPCRRQSTHVGSFMTGDLAVSAPAESMALSLGAFIWSANFAAAGVQTIIGLSSGTALQLHAGRPAVVHAESDQIHVLDQRLVDHCWYFVVASIGKGIILSAVPVDALYGATESRSWSSAHTAAASGPVTVGAWDGKDVVVDDGLSHGSARDHFNGKIEDPFVSSDAIDLAGASDLARGTARITDRALLGGWNFAFKHGDDPVAVRSMVPGQANGLLVNGPARGVTGRTFTGRGIDFNAAPAEYAAVHFHGTDLTDAGWDPVLEAPLPRDLESGVYGVVVRNDRGSDVVPIVVVPRESDTRKKVLVVLPTFTYLAYANEALFNGLDSTAMTDQPITIGIEDLAHVGDVSFGLSMYDRHPDGSGVMLSAARRPIVNMRRGYRMWLLDAGRAFSSDMYLIEWLVRRGIDVDVVTDHEIHARGADYLSPYAAILSGSHPEYTSEEMLDNLTAYRDNGGSLLYLGGNGWYWVTGVLSGSPLVVEIRRGHAGVRCWESLPGEVTLMSTGRPGGLWRHRGRAPQALAGVGFAAQGWGRSEPYHRHERSSDAAWAWIFDGVEEDPIGAYGLVMGGAAGDEIDRADPALGTPPRATILASSRGHSNFYQRVIEEIPMNLPDHGGGEQDPEVHADVVYFRTPGGGEVFSTGSIAWSGSLLHNDTDNGVSRMTENVIRAFVARRMPGA